MGNPVGTLLSVNVGMPKDVPWQGKTVFTGVFKDPVTGPRRVRKLNIDGDGQGDLAGHGGEQRAVFVYQIDSYRYWERELGRDDFVYGQFGENFTVEGLGDDEVCIGDRYRIGTAVFEVTQPRVTCYRVGIRMNDPRIPALLVSHHRPGFYFRVLEEGDVQAGDEIVKLASGPEQMTVAEVDALLYLPGHTRQQLLRALRIPALSPGWQASFRALLDGGAGQRQRRPRGDEPAPGLARLPPADRHRDHPRERLGDLDPPRGPRRRAAAGRPPGPVPHAAGPARRASSGRCCATTPSRDRPTPATTGSPSSASTTAPPAAICTPGSPSATELDVAAPRGTFILDGTHAPVLLISAGIGATPVLAMLQALAEEHSDREIWWLHGARSGRDHPFAAEARALLASLPNVRSHVCYSRPGPDDLEGRDFDSAGRLTRVAARRARAAPRCRGLPVRAGAVHGRDQRRPGGDRHRRLAHPHRAVRARAGPDAGHRGDTRARRPTRPPASPGPARRSSSPAATSPSRGAATTPACSSSPRPATSPSAGRAAPASATPARPRSSPAIVDYSPDPVEPPADGSALICCSQPRDDVVLDL